MIAAYLVFRSLHLIEALKISHSTGDPEDGGSSRDDPRDVHKTSLVESCFLNDRKCVGSVGY